METVKTDVLIIGGGLASLCAAIECCKYGVDVTIADKGRIGSSGSSPTSGASPQVLLPPELGGHPDDSSEIYFSDIVRGSDYLSDQHKAAILVDEAPQRTIEEDRMGVPFLKKPDGKFETYITFGMSYPRVGPVRLDGGGMMQALRKEALHRGARPVEDVMITRLICGDGRVQGAAGIHVFSGVPYLFKAKCVIVAAGSALAIYPYSSASYLTTGDGYALCWDLGLKFANMEFIEYTLIPAPNGIPFPTGGIKPTTGRGAIFFNRLGERFMAKYDPEKMELTSRGTIVRAIYTELKSGNGPCCLDATSLKAPTMPLRKLQEACGIDWRQEKIPWVPAVHTFLGGVMIDEKGFTGIPGLYSAGETAGHGGAFGADRVAGAIAACQVFGHRAGKYAALEALETGDPEIAESVVEQEEKRWRSLPEAKGARPRELRQKIQQVCWDSAGIIRNARDLAAGLEMISGIEHSPVKADSVPELVEALEVKNLAHTARMVIRAALERTESRGEHIREDYPERNDGQWLKWLTLQKDNNDMRVSVHELPFDSYPLKPAMTIEKGRV